MFDLSGQTGDVSDEADVARFEADVERGSVVGDAEGWRERTESAPETLDALADRYPLGRYGRPVDVADLVLFLASPASEWVSGTVIPVDGGLTATGNLPGENWREVL